MDTLAPAVGSLVALAGSLAADTLEVVVVVAGYKGMDFPVFSFRWAAQSFAYIQVAPVPF